MKFPLFTITLSLTFILLTFSSGKVFSMELPSSKGKIDSNERANYAEHANQAHLREISNEDYSDDQSAAVERGALECGKGPFEESRTSQEDKVSSENPLKTVPTVAPDDPSSTTTVNSLEGRTIAAINSEIQEQNLALNHSLEASDKKTKTNTVPPIEFINAYNRAYRDDVIDKKKKAYQAELESAKTKPALPKSKKRIESLKYLISILEQAAKYQNEMVLHLQKETSPKIKAFLHKNSKEIEQPTEKQKLDLLRNREAFIRMVAIVGSFNINSSPNKIERIVEQVEEDYKALTDYQNRLAKKKAALPRENDAPAPNQDSINRLANQVNYLNNAINYRCDFIKFTKIYATLLPLPFKEINPETQASLARNKWDCVRTKAFSQSADLYQQVLAAEDAAQHQKAIYLNNAGISLFRVAIEAQKPQPQKRAIDLYAKSADLYQQAVTAEGAGQPQKARHLKNKGTSLFRVAIEAQKPQPQNQVIAWYTRSAGLHQQAVTAEDEGKLQKAICLKNAGISLFGAAEEAQKPQPQEQVIDWYIQAADLHKQAVEAKDAGQTKKAFYLNDAGISFFSAAEEAQKTQPQDQVINAHLREAERLKQMASENSCCTIS